MWQQCPNCKGSGTTFYPLSHSTSAVCTVCKGHKIINELTSLPPNDFVNNNSCDIKTNQSTDFKNGNIKSQQEYFGK
jgi:DnaJ-class molecular chaperone